MLVQHKNPIKINTSSLCCVYCGKGYKTRLNMDKHLVLCETIYKSKNKNIMQLNMDDEEPIQLPNQRQMYNIILELTAKYNKLEEKMERFSKWVEKKKKKINVIEWLNFNAKPEFLFDVLEDKIMFSDSYLEYLLDKGFINTFSELIKNLFIEYGNRLPLFCIEQKINGIYVYHTYNEEPCWAEVDREKLIAFMNKIYMKAVKSITEWRKKLEKAYQYHGDKVDIYNKALSKLLELDLKQDSLYNKIRSIIYNNVKIDMKSMIEFEF